MESFRFVQTGDEFLQKEPRWYERSARTKKNLRKFKKTGINSELVFELS